MASHALPVPRAARLPERAPSAVLEIPLATRRFAELHDDLLAERWELLQQGTEQARRALDGRTLWSVSSTARGGGVAEMTRALWPYWRGAGLDARWLVLQAPPEFFRLTKRLHNLLHGVDLDRPTLRDHDLFQRTGRLAGARAADVIAPGDVVVLQDPQTAGLVPILKHAGALVVWRCHVGADVLTDPVDAAWRFLRPYIASADAFVFTRRSFVAPGIPWERVHLVAPAIDPRSAKNQHLSAETTAAILDYCGIVRGDAPSASPRVPVHGRMVRVRRRCGVVREGGRASLGASRLVVALLRWDRLKDPVGIIGAFAEHVGRPDARLVVAGPVVAGVADDPEGGAVLGEARAAWRRLPASERARIDIVTLPMAEPEENALIVNALQREAAVVVKKSIQEGFGLGVTEAMWKARPVVATRVGGHQDQIEHRRTGLLVGDPHDARAFGGAISELLDDRAQAMDLAGAARERARERLLADRHFIDWTGVLSALVAAAPAR